MSQRVLSMLFGVGGLAALAALWVGVLTYGIRPNVSTLGIGQLISLIALPPLGVWGAATATVLWRKHQTARNHAAAADAEQAERERQAALAEASRARELMARQRPMVVRMIATVDAPASDNGNIQLGVTTRCQALAQAALDELHAIAPQILSLPVLAQVPIDAALALQSRWRDMACFDNPADLLLAASQQLDATPELPGVIVLAVDSPRALLDAAPTRFNPDSLQDEPDLDLPLRGEASEMAVALLLTRENSAAEEDWPALARLHQAAGAGQFASIAETLAAAALNGKLLPSNDSSAVASAPGVLIHTAGTDKAGGAMLARLAMNLPEFSRELDVIDDALNVPRALGDFGVASFWVGVSKAIEHVNELGTPSLCVDCQSPERMSALIVNPVGGAA